MPRLTDTRCRTAKPSDAPYLLQDGRGLYLEVRPTGLKVWRYRYWLTPERAGRYTIGHYPTVSLGDARKERERIRAMVAAGKMVRAAYNHAAYLVERREMMQSWGDSCRKFLHKAETLL